MARTAGFTVVLLTAATLGIAGEGRLAPPRPTAAVLTDDISTARSGLSRDLAEHAEAAGYAARPIDVALLTNAMAFNSHRFDLVILPDARGLPASSVNTLEAYLQAGGDLLALGLPAWQRASVFVGGRWISRPDFDQAVAATQPTSILKDFDQEDLARWQRASDRGDAGTRVALVPRGQGRALHVVITNLTGWDTLGSPPLLKPFPPGHAITCFRAKGGPRTHQLAVEWTEQDGSRWIATVDLSPDWKEYALPPETFKAWTPPPGRGGKGDRFDPQRAVRVVVGLAHSHTAVEGVHHEYWFDDLGTAPHPFGEVAPPESPRWPHLEGFSPEYLFFPVTGAVEIGPPARVSRSREVVRWTRETSAPLLAMHPRPQGVGLDQGRPSRWEPLLEARADSDEYRGAVAALIVNERGPFRGGVWACFTPAEPEFYGQPAVRRLLRDTLTAMNRGVFLLEGGSEFFTVFEGQAFQVGARVANFSRQPRTNLAVRISVSAPGETSVAWSKQWSILLATGVVERVGEPWTPTAWPSNGFNVTTELTADGQVIDRLQHELHVWRPKPKPDFIEARDGGLWLRGQPWKAHGVNYMPSSGIGLANSQHFEHWIGRGAYDPEVIDRDLRRIVGMGLNSVSAFIHHQSLDAQHLLDFLRRCEALDLRVNLSLRPGTPMDFRWKEMKDLIEFYRLAQNDTVFAYDLAWEPSHYDENHQRRQYTTAWNEWALKRHGSIEAAEKAWGLPAPRGEGTRSAAGKPAVLAIPSMRQLTRDGPWRKLVADYRLFLDQLLGARYAEARRLVKSIDLNHPVSFRMQHAGDPTHNWDQMLAYDFLGLTDAVDLWEPEAYGRIGDWEKVKAGHFTAAYARLCDPAKPVVWAEMGYSVWDLNRMAPHPEKLAFGARYYADFYRLMIESGADGIFFWWYPGGYRLNERSDFGILNPDGTDRAITEVIRRDGRRFLDAPKPPRPNFWIAVDRDRDARGLFGIYEAVQAEYWRAVSEGRTPGLRWTKRPGAEQSK